MRPATTRTRETNAARSIYDDGVTLADTWRALEHLVDDGHCRSIGLSNVSLQALRDIVAVARIKPAVVQVESHPYLPEWELLDYCLKQGIVLQAFAALGHSLSPRVVDDPVITEIAQSLHVTAGQVVLAWAVQRGSAFLTTSTKPEHIQENFGISPLPEEVMPPFGSASPPTSGSTPWWQPAYLDSSHGPTKEANHESGRVNHRSQSGNRGGDGIGPRRARVPGGRQLPVQRRAGAAGGLGHRYEGGEALAIRADVTMADDVDAMIKEVNEKWGSVDALVHNALIPFDGHLLRRCELGSARWQVGRRAARGFPDH